MSDLDNYLIIPQYSEIKSRKDVSLHSEGMDLPVISANMDTITGPRMAKAMLDCGAGAALHRFCSIEDNVKMLDEVAHASVFVSVGVGEEELARAKALYDNGACKFIVDVAHGSQKSVVEQVVKIRKHLGNKIKLIVGNFASPDSVIDFVDQLSENCVNVDGIKVGLGNGSACLTRDKTGVGYPQIFAIQEIKEILKGIYTPPFVPFIIADGGCQTPGDIAKCLAAGAHAVMIGGMLAGTDEVPKSAMKMVGESDIIFKYRGSASKESYEVQGKEASWRTPEGKSVEVESKGPVIGILKDIEGGLRSAFTYVGAKNLEEFHERAKLVKI